MNQDRAMEEFRNQIFYLEHKINLLKKLTGTAGEFDRLWPSYCYNEVGLPNQEGKQKGYCQVNKYPLCTVSVITAASRGTKHLSKLLEAMSAQTFKDFEHLIIYDGKCQSDVRELMSSHPGFYELPEKSKDKYPGTTPRNIGIRMARGDWVCFMDDDDRPLSNWLESLTTPLRDDCINLTQMVCSETRVKAIGDKSKRILLPKGPELIAGRIGTPNFIVKREHALLNEWRDEKNHDYLFIKQIQERYGLNIQFHPGCTVNVGEK